MQLPKGSRSYPFSIIKMMKIIIFLLFFSELFFSGCRFEEQADSVLIETSGKDSLKIIKSERLDEIVIYEEEKSSLPLSEDFAEVTQKTIIDTIKETPTANIEQEKQKKDASENESGNFIRGLYLTAYKTASQDFYKILDLADSAKINTIVFDLKNMNGEVFFKTAQNELLRRENHRPILDIVSVVNTLHERNMKAVSRMVMFHDMFNAVRDSTLRPQLPDGSVWMESRKRGPAWLDSSHPVVQNYLLGLIEEAAKLGVDEIQLDYIRFPTQGNAENAVYYFQKADSLMLEQDSTYVLRTKADIITGFLRRAKKICEKYQVTLTADVFAIVAWQRDVDIASTGQNIAQMTRHLDFIHPMIYSSHFADNFGYRENVFNEPYFILYKGTKLTQQNTKESCRAIPYIQANNWKVNYKREYIISQIKAIEELNASGYILWNSSNIYTRTLTWLKEYYETE